MTLTDFLQYWGLAENPFAGEEARSDGVFTRMNGLEPAQVEELSVVSVPSSAFHSDFDKVLGDLRRPNSAVVFGEKGSGKTAMKLQLAARVREHNEKNPLKRVMLVVQDDLDGMLTRVHDRYEGKTPLDSFHRIRAVDHLDQVMISIVSRLVDAILDDGRGEDRVTLTSPEPVSKVLDQASRRDLVLLQALYDRPEDAEFRTWELARRLKVNRSIWSFVGRGVLGVIPLLIGGAYLWLRLFLPETLKSTDWLNYGFIAAAGLYALLILKVLIWDILGRRQIARRVKKQLVVTGRGFRSFARTLAEVDPSLRDSATLPTSSAFEARQALLDKVRRILGQLGYASIVVIIDRVDEPSLVNGNVDCMKAIIWPLLNNKILQQEGVGFKLLLPIELRHALYKESSSFFQEARLDKQCLVERLGWSGAMLYDLCNARLKSCINKTKLLAAELSPELAPTLAELFAEDVTRAELVASLEQLHQPRDAFKFLYHCIVEHCANVTKEDGAWRIPKHTLESVRKQEVERVQGVYRGIRPG